MQEYAVIAETIVVGHHWIVLIELPFWLSLRTSAECGQGEGGVIFFSFVWTSFRMAPKSFDDMLVKAVQVKPALYRNLSKESHNNKVKENVWVEVAHFEYIYLCNYNLRLCLVLIMELPYFMYMLMQQIRCHFSCSIHCFMLHDVALHTLATWGWKPGMRV